MKVEDIQTVEQVRNFLKLQKAYAHILRYDKYSHIRDVLYANTGHLHKNASFGLRVRFFVGEISECPTCPVCGNDRIPQKGRADFQETCGRRECVLLHRNEKRIITSQERYGTNHPNQNKDVYQRIVDTNMRRYGAKSPLMTEEQKKKSIERITSPEVKGKRRKAVQMMWQTRKDQLLDAMRAGMNEKYGVTNAAQIPHVVEKMHKTHIDRYGGWFLTTDQAKHRRIEVFGKENYFQTEEFKNKLKEKNLIELGCEHHLQRPLMFNKLNDTEWLLEQYQTKTTVSIAEELNTTPSTVWRYLNAAGVTESLHGGSCISEPEQQIVDIITELGFQCERNTRSVIPPYELDIYIPEKNLAIEFNGVYWHSDKFRDKNFHQKKSLMCMELGIQLIHVWSDDWYFGKKSIIEKKIKHKLQSNNRVYARKCSLTLPETRHVRELYENNHIQGFVRATHHIGLKHNDELVACASFHNRNDDGWELVRFASSLSVVGGFSKILKEFKRIVPNFGKIYTFAHLDYSHGGVYEACGFEKKHTTVPGMFYTKGSIRERREKYMKKNLPKLLTHFDETKSERENMMINGYKQIFDAGSIRYEMYQ